MDDPKPVMRCPMCGKENDAAVKRCTFCRAVLHEFDISDDAEEPASSDDWLSSLRDAGGIPLQQEGEVPAQDSGQFEPLPHESLDDAPDWLQRIRQRVAEDSAQPVSEPGTKQEAADERLPEWLQGMMHQEGADNSAPSAAGFAGNDQDESDWLAQLRQSDEMVSGPGEEILIPDEDEAVEPIKPDELESRLSSLNPWQGMAEPVEPEAEAAAPTAPLSPGMVVEQPDEAEAFTPGGEQTEFPLPPAKDEEEIPDWLKKLQMSASPLPDEIPEEEGRLPDWLQGFEAVTPGSSLDEVQPSQPEMEGTAEAAGQVPAFEEELPQIEPMEEAAAGLPGEQPHEVEEPALGEGWVFEEHDEVEPEQAAALPAAEAELPGWLSSLNMEPSSTAVDTPMPFNEDEFPAWLEGLTPDENEEVPAFLPDFELDKALTKPPADEALPFEGSEQPDWLEELSQPSGVTGSEELLSTQEEILPAELPTWLEAMRPDVTQNPSFSSQNVFQQEGPLAGLPEILPSQLFKNDYAEGFSRGGKLKVTPEQQASADIVAALLGKMGDAASVQPPGRKKAYDWLRPVFTLLLLAAIILPMIFGSAGFSQAVLSPSGEAAYALLQSVDATRPVLVAFDYEPAYSGELSAAGQAVLQQLIQKNARLAFLSTTPAGAVFADDVLKTSFLSVNPGADETAFTAYRTALTANLGYLPGSSASLQEFINSPQQAARYGLNAALDGVPTWNLPALAGVDSLDDFGLVLVLTDSAALGRTWVEQVGPALGSVPLVMVSSAAASPMLLPYYESKQIGGLVAGMADGLAYQQLSPVQSFPAVTFVSLKAAAGLAALALLAGLAVYAWQSLRANRSKE